MRPFRSVFCSAIPAAALIALTLTFTPAAAIVVTGLDPLPAPDNGWVGAWNGSSAVAIGEHWIITAHHVGGGPGGIFTMKGVQYHAVETREHSTMDLLLVRVSESLPGWHHIAMNPALGDPVLLGGYGVTGGAALPGGGYDWNGPMQETWGANTIEGEGNLLTVRFDPPSSPQAVPHEAIFAVHDSGAGMFTFADDGSLELAGIAVSVTNYGSSPYMTVAFALNVSTIRNWLVPIVDPGDPVTSGSAPPRQ